MSANGGPQSHGQELEGLSQIHQALDAVHSPHSQNDARRQAQDFLEKIKDHAEAPAQGYELAADKSQSPIVRHYALSLLEHAIQYRWSTYTEEQAAALRRWVILLGQALDREDPLYLRNKTAQLWVEVAKRCWGAEWMDMDSMLAELWQASDSVVHKELVMFVLETLSDEIFTGDDPVVAMREGVLSKACVEIFTPTAVLLEVFPNRQPGPDVRCGHEGWLNRLSELLDYCINSNQKDNPEVKACAIRALSVFLSLMPWAIPRAVAAANCVRTLTTGLASPVAEIQKGSLEALHALYYRANFNDEEFKELVGPMYTEQSVDLCRNLLLHTTVDPEDIDLEKYQISKKLAEMLSCLGEYFDRKYTQLSSEAAREKFLQVLLQVAQCQSLMVSIPVMVAWNRLINSSSSGPAQHVMPLIAPLLELCSSRMVRYENLPEDSTDPIYLFLMEDTDTIPERHVFLGNYRRYCSYIIESVVNLRPFDAVSHVLGGTERVLQSLYDGEPQMNKQTYQKHSMPVLRVDAHFTVIESTIKGYLKWRKRRAEANTAEELNKILESWCDKILSMNFVDPLIRKRTLQLVVYLSTTVLNQNAEFMLKVLEHILVTWPALEPEYRTYNDAIKDLQGESMVELQRLATDMPEHLLRVYDQIEGRVKEMLSSGALDEKRTLAYKSFLFLIIHRASNIDLESKVQNLHQFIDPVKSQWRTDEVQASLASYSDFCGSLALDKAQAYLANRNAHSLKDWGACKLDDEGRSLQAELEDRLKMLPLRPTKAFLAFSVEKLSKSSEAFRASSELWRDGFSEILRDLLKFLSYAHACHNPENWQDLPSEMRPMVDRVLSDRFWQAGISEGSKDDFYSRVIDKKYTIEGLASTIRGSVRFVRETAYAIIYCMSRLDLQFYGHVGLSEPLSTALFADSIWLSTHQQSHLLNLVRYLVDDCPVDYREQLLPDLLSACFRQMDAKISGEWEKMAQQQIAQADGEAGLKEEMKAESILRQVTYTAVVMVADFLDPTKPNAPTLGSRVQNGDNNETEAAVFPSLRKFCLTESKIVEPLLIFCVHGIGMRDTRCCSMVLRLFISLVPEFHLGPTQVPRKSPTANSPAQKEGTPLVDNSPVPPELAGQIREYISIEVLKACITSFHEGYFVDVQKELASLIAAIVVYYSPVTTTPREILLQLPNINPADLDRLGEYVEKPASHTRQQRAIVLDLLKDLKGVSVSELGKLQKSAGFARPARDKKSGRTKMAQQFMTEQPQGSIQGPFRTLGDRTFVLKQATPEALEGVSNLFDNQ